MTEFDPLEWPLGHGRSRRSPGHNGQDSSSYPLDVQRERVPIIVHSHLRWSYVWQRPQQIFSRLADSHPILFLEEPVCAATRPGLLISEPYPDVVRVVPVMPLADKGADAQWAAQLALLKRAMREHPLLAQRFHQPLQWFYSPMFAPRFLGQFGAAAVVYDCMDQLSHFRFAAPDIGERERFLLSSADVVFTGGYELFRDKAQSHRNVHFYGCGVDVGHYAKALRASTMPPAAVANLPRPIFGYVGVIDERLDYVLLGRLARRFPHGSVVMVGPLAKVDRDMLPGEPNIRWLGQRPYADLPALVKAFDVCLMPFVLNETTQYINPTKTLEYLAAGKPVVSTAVPDVVRNFAPIVRVAYGAEAFVSAVGEALQRPDADLVAQGMARARAASWDSVVARMRRDCLKAL